MKRILFIGCIVTLLFTACENVWDSSLTQETTSATNTEIPTFQEVLAQLETKLPATVKLQHLSPELLERIEAVYNEYAPYAEQDLDMNEIMQKIFSGQQSIQTRASDLSVLPSLRSARLAQPMAAALEFGDYLGRSFKTDYFPFESMQNVGYPVVDIQKLNEDNPSWSFSHNLRISEATSFAYYGFDRYQVNSTITNKVSSGFQINLGLFKLGNKKTMTEVFTSSKVDESNTVFGQLDVEIKDAAYELTLNSNRIRQILLDYIDKDFQSDLHHMTPAETFKFYGGFVLSNFITGGRATAVYSAYDKSTESVASVEDNMTQSITASFGFKKDSTSTGASAELGFGINYGNGSLISNKLSQFETSVKTLGGAYGATTFTVPKTIDNLNIDLTQWVNSLNNSQYHTIIDIQNEGLVPITEFVMEDNLKKHLNSFYETGMESIGELQKPVLKLYSNLDNSNLYFYWVLFNRFGDNILLNYLYIPWENGSSSFLDSFLISMATAFIGTALHEIYHYIYDIELVPMVDSVDMNTVYKFCELKKVSGSDFDTLVEEYIELNGLSTLEDEEIFVYIFTDKELLMRIFPEMIPNLEKNMVKFFDTENNMIYLLYNQNNIKMGYALHLGFNSFLLDTYGMRKFIKDLPEINIDRSELLNYTIIAL